MQCNIITTETDLDNWLNVVTVEKKDIKNYIIYCHNLNIIGPRLYFGTSLDDHMEVITNGIIPKIYIIVIILKGYKILPNLWLGGIW